MTFYSKSPTPFRLPVAADHKHPRQQRFLLTSQLLRMWRLSTNDVIFSIQVRRTLSILHTTGLENSLRSAICQYLSPVRISRSIWSTSHLVCPQCTIICINDHILVKKILLLGTKPIASRIHTNCHSPRSHRSPACLYLIPRHSTNFSS